MTRSARPSGVVGSGDLVIVELQGPVRRSRPRSAATWSPSWFRQVSSRSASSRASSYDDERRASPRGVTFPFAQTGQRVSFCAENQSKDHVADLRYVARVITPGTYAWEPAVVESRTSANHGALTGSGTVTIR